MATTPKYTAFISYSRKDEEAVKNLYHRLTQYRLPKPLREKHGVSLGRFFLDKEELGAAGQLDEELNEKLDEAGRLIVCCSPSAAASKWVNAETKAFIERHGRDRLLAVVLDGEPHDAFPPALMEDEPLAADFRLQGDGEENGFLKLVAGLLYVDLGELRDLQAKAERQRARIRNGLVVLFAFLTVAATFAAVVAVQANRRAERMAAEAIAIGSGVLGEADSLSRRFGVPTSALESLLEFADDRFARLFDEGVKSSALMREQLRLRVQFSRLRGRVGDTKQQAKDAERAVQILRRDLPPDEIRTIDYVEALCTYGEARYAVGDNEGAVEAYRDGIRAARQMLTDIPDGVLARNRLAAALQRLGHILMTENRPKEALPLFEEATDRLDEIVTQAPDDRLAPANAIIGRNWVASAQALSGEYGAAIETFRTSVADAKTYLEEVPDSLPTLGALGSAQMKLGQALSDQNYLDEGRASLVDSVESSRRMVAADPRDANRMHELATRIGLVANLDLRRRDPKAAVDGFGQAAELYDALIEEDPAQVVVRIDYAKMLAVEAFAWTKLGDPNASLARRTKAADQWSAIVDVETETRVDRLEGIASAFELMGDAAAQARQLESMLKAYERATPIRRRLRTLDDTPDRRNHLAQVLHALGLTRKFAQKLPTATDALAEAADLRQGLDTPEGRFAAADSLQQLALVQANADGEASKASLIRARDLLRDLVKAFPDRAAYVESLQKTEKVLSLIDRP